MRVRRALAGAALLATCRATCFAGSAPAQSPQKPRIGYAAPPPSPAPVPAPAPAAPPTVYYIVADGGYYPVGAPYLVLSDGSVLVSFGAGYERVLRPCVPVRPVTPPDPWARDALGRIPDPPAIAALKAGARGQMQGAIPARTREACYLADSQGRATVVVR